MQCCTGKNLPTFQRCPLILAEKNDGQNHAPECNAAVYDFLLDLYPSPDPYAILTMKQMICRIPTVPKNII